MSTCAPDNAVHAPEAYAETANCSANGSPGRGLGLAMPFVSERISDRFSLSSTQYGPLVTFGSNTQEALVPASGVPASVLPDDWSAAAPPQRKSNAAAPKPKPVLPTALNNSLRLLTSAFVFPIQSPVSMELDLRLHGCRRVEDG